MIYLSKGRLCKGSTKQCLLISRFGGTTELTGQDAEIWLNGQSAFALVHAPEEVKAVDRLAAKGFVRCDNRETEMGKFFILTKCLILPIKTRWPRSLLKKKEKRIMVWLKKAGMYLSIAELVFLIENNVEPTSDLLYKRNRLRLNKRIYPTTVIIANALENCMVHALCRYQVVDTLMQLLRKRYVAII